MAGGPGVGSESSPPAPGSLLSGATPWHSQPAIPLTENWKRQKIRCGLHIHGVGVTFPEASRLLCGRWGSGSTLLERSSLPPACLVPRLDSDASFSGRETWGWGACGQMHQIPGTRQTRAALGRLQTAGGCRRQAGESRETTEAGSQWALTEGHQEVPQALGPALREAGRLSEKHFLGSLHGRLCREPP